MANQSTISCDQCLALCERRFLNIRRGERLAIINHSYGCRFCRLAMRTIYRAYLETLSEEQRDLEDQQGQQLLLDDIQDDEFVGGLVPGAERMLPHRSQLVLAGEVA